MTTPDRDTVLREVRAMLARARPEQIERLLRDIRDTGGGGEAA
ncbi:hypothetical protein [Pseudoponticoccus marisrubri]|nr:hypothetical protein [Pseudoponticoccus marisrubri]